MSTVAKVIIPSDEILQERQLVEEEISQWASADGVRYFQKEKAVAIYMKSGVAVSVPISLISELRDASVNDLSHVSLSIGGDAISWRLLDVDISLSGLLRDVLGLNFQRLGGRSKSEKKAAAARENGTKGGRPPKTDTVFLHVSNSDKVPEEGEFLVLPTPTPRRRTLKPKPVEGGV